MLRAYEALVEFNAYEALNTDIDDVWFVKITELLFTDNEPVIPTEPVSVWVFVKSLPNTFDPLEYTTEEDTVCTTNFCAVTVPVNNALDPLKSPLILKVLANDDVCAYDALVAIKAYDALVAFKEYEELNAYEALVALLANDDVKAYDALVAFKA